MANSTTIPIIDVAGLFSGASGDRRAVAREMRVACCDTGFFYVTNHGLDDAFLDGTFAQSKRFFELPLAEKERIDLAKSPISRGYEPIGGQQLDLTASRDLKESVYLGVDRGPDDPLVVAETPNHGPNQWPDGLAGWREYMEDAFGRLSDLSRALSRGLALSLDMPEDHFAAMETDPMSILRLLRYPPHPKDAGPDQFGCGAHTDWGCLTILAQKESEGLELRNAAGDWILARPIPDTLVINLGDMMARWTNDLYQSTPHRVINKSGGERYSIAFFHDVNYHALVECLPTCQGADSPAKYRPILAGDHIYDMYQKTYIQGAAE